jgi:hypothetical protein
VAFNLYPATWPLQCCVVVVFRATGRLVSRCSRLDIVLALVFILPCG